MKMGRKGRSSSKIAPRPHRDQARGTGLWGLGNLPVLMEREEGLATLNFIENKKKGGKIE